VLGREFPSNKRLGNDVKMADNPDIIVSIDLGTTYTGIINCFKFTTDVWY
jgi:hypothetical protein